MRYAPSPQELLDIGVMPAPQRLQYFLTRVTEAEEVWGLADPQGWILHEVGDRTILSIWPYRQCAEACLVEPGLHPFATSLDHFVERILHTLVEDNIYLDILPSRDAAGAVLSAAELQGMLESMLESGEYFLEG